MYYNSSTGQAKVCLGGSWAAVGVPTVTSLPANPSDGDEVYYKIDRGDGTYGYWHLRYNASTTYWDFLGGPNIRVSVGVQSTSSNSNQSTGSPSITLPANGDYMVNYGAGNLVSGVSGDNSMRVALVYNTTELNTVLVRGSVYASNAANYPVLETGLTSGSTLKTEYRSDASSLSYFYGMFVELQPVRIK